MSFALPQPITWTVQSTGAAVLAVGATLLQFQAAAVHVGLRGLPGDVHPDMPILLAQTDAAKTAAQDAAANAATSASASAASAAAAAAAAAAIVGGIGNVVWHAASSAPAGSLKANGAAVSRSTYAALFAVIGTTWGAGDGATTFNLPDLRGEFVRGWDDARGIDAARAFASAQGHAFQAHDHVVATAYHQSGTSADGTKYPGINATQITASAKNTNGVAAGYSSASETRPRNVALLACIKYQA